MPLSMEMPLRAVAVGMVATERFKDLQAAVGMVALQIPVQGMVIPVATVVVAATAAKVVKAEEEEVALHLLSWCLQIVLPSYQIIS